MTDRIFFITLTVRRWYYLFDRHNRWGILADSLEFCRKNKGLKLFAYVFMLNHVHLIFKAENAKDFLRDFKRHTARKILDNIRMNEPNIEKLFLNDKGSFELWQSSNMPETIDSELFFMQKLKYLHNNPVRKEYVNEPRDWHWSSARFYETGEDGPIKIDSFE